MPLRVPSASAPYSSARALHRAAILLEDKQIDEEVLWELERYPWAGNMRELENVLERMLIMSGERVTTVTNLPEELGNVSQAAVELGIGRPYLHKRMAVLGIAKRDIYA